MKVYISPYCSKRIDYVRIDQYDIWNMDTTLAKVILPMLLLFKQNGLDGGMGVPHDFTKGMPEQAFNQQLFAFIEDTRDDAYRVAFKKWLDVIDLMIWTFYHLSHSTVHGRMDEVPEEYRFDGTLTEFSNRIQEGLDAFAKHYTFFWD